jgi:hypothetical protein
MNKLPRIIFPTFLPSSPLIDNAISTQLKIDEIAMLTKSTGQDVWEFYKSHSYSLDFIKHAVLLCGRLDKDEMEKAILKGMVGGL